jgi:DNA polymerase III delta prime subunit
MKDETFVIKYKPYYIRDFSFNNHLFDAINELVKLDYLNLLFVGESSTCKTTLLYALIREYYGLAKDASLPESNILFINNLKEQGIQYFRNEMKTFCQSHSNIYGKKKLVVIDDIDNINEQSQQVFRNYLDKYKNNIHFISVCTNIQKVIESLQSRLHIIHIEKPSCEQIRNIMNNIITSEHIVIDEESKDYLLSISQYSIRVLINFLEKMHIYNEPININICKDICSTISFHLFEKYLMYLKNKNLLDSISLLNHIHSQGYSVIDILDYFFFFIKHTDLINEKLKYQIIPYLCKYITVFHTIHEDQIELALFTNNLMKLF